ncbi:hypothetical protein DEFR109230_08095 [Deinococcus frigens]
MRHTDGSPFTAARTCVCRPKTAGSQASTPTTASRVHTPIDERHAPPSAVISGTATPEASAAPPTTASVYSPVIGPTRSA